MGVAVEQVHAEAGSGQFEIVTQCSDPLQVTALPRCSSCMCTHAHQHACMQVRRSSSCARLACACMCAYVQLRLLDLSCWVLSSSCFDADPCPPALQAADALILTREAIAAVAGAHGLVASFLPLPLPGQSGSACHCHLSLWQVPPSPCFPPPSFPLPFPPHPLPLYAHAPWNSAHGGISALNTGASHLSRVLEACTFEYARVNHKDGSSVHSCPPTRGSYGPWMHP